MDGLSICIGQPDTHFIIMVTAKKRKVVSPDGKVAAYVNDDTCSKTVCTTYCESSTKYQSCKAHRSNLRSSVMDLKEVTPPAAT